MRVRLHLRRKTTNLPKMKTKNKDKDKDKPPHR